MKIDLKFFEKYKILWISSILLLTLSLILFFWIKSLGTVAILATLTITYLYYSFIVKSEKEEIDRIENLDKAFSDSTRAAVFGMPFPLALSEVNGKIKWYNNRFKELFPEKDILGENIVKFIPGLKLEEIIKSDTSSIINAEISDKNFQFYYNKVDTYEQKREKLILFYGIDNTADEIIKKSYYKDASVVMVIHIDNYDEISSTTDENNRPLVYAELDKEINSFAVEYKGFARKYESDKYLCIFRKEALDKMIEDKFPIMERVKSAENYSSIPPTLSIGVGAMIDVPLEIYKVARLAVDVALGRGGDQIVINDGKSMSFYGGKKKAVEKHNKVKARVISHALAQLVDDSDEVFVMGHKNPDMDSYGSCLGLYAFAKSRGKEIRIVLNEVTPQIEALYKLSVEELTDLRTDIIKPEEALKEITNSSLVVVLDNHRKNSTEAPELLDETERVVLIDHHRRGADYIEDPTLIYHEPYASSASELVTELIQYNEDDIDVPEVVANGLLAGITVDTKSFSLQTGVRTFEAASLLKRFGADSIIVKKLFREPVDTVKFKSDVIAASRIINDVVAIGRFEEKSEASVLVAAQAADGMLEMKGIKASFVLTYFGGKVHISGRSVGDISVQIILEKLGGGGHQTSSGAQIEGEDMDYAEEKLIKAINDYMEEENESNTKK